MGKITTARDILGDPSSWAGVPIGFAEPREDYLLAKLGSVVNDGKYAHIVVVADGRQYHSDIGVKDELEAERIAARLQQLVGDLLREALNTQVYP